MRYKMIVAYNGANYCGWQKQQHGKSIQEVIEQFLSRIFNTNIAIVGSGRTDRGVHALGQVVHFDSDKVIDTDKLQYALNNFLPSDIRIKQIEIVGDLFHARFSAISKIYQYRFTLETTNPFISDIKTIIQKQPDVILMQEAANLFLGTHDFTSFTSAKIDPRKSRIRTIYDITVIQDNYDIMITLHGNGFLRYMVRMICQVILEVGLKNLTLQQVENMLVLKNKDVSRYKAASNGLYLMEVIYDKS